MSHLDIIVTGIIGFCAQIVAQIVAAICARRRDLKLMREIEETHHIVNNQRTVMMAQIEDLKGALLIERERQHAVRPSSESFRTPMEGA